MASPSENPAPLRPPQVTLRGIWFWTTVLCILLGLSWWMPPISLSVLILALLAIGAHILGNSLGTKLRDGAKKIQHEHSMLLNEPLTTDAFAPPSHLTEKQNSGGFMSLAAIVGVIGGMLLGWWIMRSIYGEHVTGLALGLTLVACGILGGLSSFMLTMFLHVILITWRQSTQHK